MSDVDDLLERVRERLRTTPSCGVARVDRLVGDALRPGKLLRPDLVLRSAVATGSDLGRTADVERRVIEGALSVELLHVATLVHDDIIDAADVRRGRPSVVASAGVATAIVVGDLLLARGAAAAARSSGAASGVWARTLDCMAAGQLREAGLAESPSLEAHAEYASLKTAELFRSSAEIGALAAGAAPWVVEAHGTFGLHFGMAFQHVDDLLDLVGDAGRMGKPTGADATNGVPTAISLLSGRDGLEEVAGLIADELEEARAALRPGPGAAALATWAGGALRRAARAAVDPADRDLDARLTTAFGRLDDASDPRAWELRPCRTSSSV
ncbi:octaprenyl-diphosphate synthase/geranylgeranyl diphosphate synthase, type I [Nocardioides alpinus]|uniref:Octaprenyl-diphosphate synthase/geranylgeranyl diphosphate synthase, type I n=1 Tax=Nocardioides alpinus TaxID=748909 RepID=A0A1I0XKA3_9ACTN|nr:polyprenyl synthetase family protein [Nocardioides alpinus]SFB01559.1 octaprenyl-diphosphate synthase/geranylgeranyl diphosphate synthase, type I [Nocardioides alpinus]